MLKKVEGLEARIRMFAFISVHLRRVLVLVASLRGLGVFFGLGVRAGPSTLNLHPKP